MSTNPDFMSLAAKKMQPIIGTDFTNNSPIDPWTAISNPTGPGTIRDYRNYRVRTSFLTPAYIEGMIEKLAGDIGKDLVGEFQLSGDFDTDTDPLGRKYGYVPVNGVSIVLNAILSMVASGNDANGNQIYSADKYQLGVPTDWKLVGGKFIYTPTPPAKQTADGPPGVLTFTPALLK